LKTESVQLLHNVPTEAVSSVKTANIAFYARVNFKIHSEMSKNAEREDNLPWQERYYL